MSTQFPAKIDDSATLPTAIDNSTVVNGKTVNELRNAIIAIETALGVNPASVYGTVRERLRVIEEAITGGGGGGGDTVIFGGDLTGSSISQTVIGLRGNAISNEHPTDGYILTWSNSSMAWEPKPYEVAVSFTAGGDLSGTTSSQTVIKVNGTTYPAGGSLTTGAIPIVSGSSTVSYGLINNINVGTSAAIDYSKLNLGGNIVNSDIKISAAITYSKLSLANSIINSDIGTSAAIAYSKLNLNSSIVNTDIAISAAIAYSKLNLSGSIINTDIGSSAAIAYSKLNLSTSIVNADVSTSADITVSKIAPSVTNGDILTTSSGITSWGPAFNPSRITPLDANHLHAWELNEASGNFIDTGSTLAPVNLTVTTLTPPVYGTPGIVGLCPNFGFITTGVAASSVNGGTANINLFSDLPTGSCTIEGWVCSQANGCGGTGFFGVSLTSTNDVFALASDGGNGYQLTSRGTIGSFSNGTAPGTRPLVNPGVWHHLAIVFDQSAGKAFAYRDGQCIITQNQSGSIVWQYDATARFAFGMSTFMGQMSKIRLSNIARSQSYLYAVYKKGIGF